MSEINKVIEIQGQRINYEKLSDAQLLKLYEQLKMREAKLYEKLMDYKEQYDFLPDIDVNTNV